MKQVYALLTRVISFLAFPVKGLFLHNSRRVRVLVIHNNKILLQKSSIGTQKWSIPGGGIEKGENPVHAAIRETFEETNIMLAEKSVICIGEQRVPSNKRWPVSSIVFYTSNLAEPQQPKITRPLEILEVKWFSLSELPDERSKTVDTALSLASS